MIDLSKKSHKLILSMNPKNVRTGTNAKGEHYALTTGTVAGEVDANGNAIWIKLAANGPIAEQLAAQESGAFVLVSGYHSKPKAYTNASGVTSESSNFQVLKLTVLKPHTAKETVAA